MFTPLLQKEMADTAVGIMDAFARVEWIAEAKN